jgi:nucleotide-binding universal stress UspA family protein
MLVPIKKILAPIAFDQSQSDSLDYAIQLAKQLGATVCVLHVYAIPLYSFPDGTLITSAEFATKLSETAQKFLDEVVKAHQGRGVDLSSVLATGDSSEEIVRVAKAENVDLIIMGTHGRHGMSRALLGSVAEQVLRTSTVPVLAVRGSEPPR